MAKESGKWSQFNMQLTEEDRRRLDEVARWHGLSVSATVRHVMKLLHDHRAVIQGEEIVVERRTVEVELTRQVMTLGPAPVTERVVVSGSSAASAAANGVGHG